MAEKPCDSSARRKEMRVPSTIYDASSCEPTPELGATYSSWWCIPWTHSGGVDKGGNWERGKPPPHWLRSVAMGIIIAAPSLYGGYTALKLGLPSLRELAIWGHLLSPPGSLSLGAVHSASMRGDRAEKTCDVL